MEGKLPINVKFLFEGDEETSSPSLSKFPENNQKSLKNYRKQTSACGKMGARDEEGRPWARFGVREV
ncbi:MAG: hypothetical protein ACLVBJ_11930 [Pilosibacter sp.]